MPKQFYEYEPTGADRELEHAEQRERKLKAENATLREKVRVLREALDPDTLEAVASEIDCFKHSARAHGLRVIAEQQRHALEATKETT